MTLAKIFAIAMLVSLTFGAGLRVNRDHLKSVVSNIGLLARALLANVVIVPVLGVVITAALRLNPFVATGILLMAISPGVPFVLSGIQKKGGSLSLAVTLAVLLPIVSIVTIPITAQLVLPVQATAELPIARFITTLVLFQLLPIVAGIALTSILGRRIPQLERACDVLFAITLVALLAALAPRIAHALSVIFGSLGIIAVMFIVALSAATGWLLGGPDAGNRRVLSLGTTLRNIGFVASIATASYREPEIVAAAMTYFVVQVIASIGIGVYFARSARRAIA